MHSRQSIIELFSTFVQFESERFSRWATDPNLRRSMQRCLTVESQLDTSDEFWVFYWHQVWQVQPASLARAHLSAYLQEACYWAAHDTVDKFANNQYSLSDFFQIAISRVDTVLKGFNPKQGFTLKNYASPIFSSYIREFLRQRQEVDICTDFALLRKLSQKRLVESLQQAGLSEETIASYVLAWTCFKILYVPVTATVTRKLPPPDSGTWEASAKLYNAERYAQLNPSTPECSAETLEKWLMACAKSARSYLYPPFVSLNAPAPGQNFSEFLDELSQFSQASILTELIDWEAQQLRQVQLAEIGAVLTEALHQLDSQAQTLLQLYYGQKLTQQQIAQQLEIQQSTLSRRLTKSRKVLLLALAQWSKEKLHKSLSSDLIKDMSLPVEEWLKIHYNQSDRPSPREDLL